MPAFPSTHTSLSWPQRLAPHSASSARNALAPETHYTGSSGHPPSGRGLLCSLPCCIPGPGTEPVPGHAPKCVSVKWMGVWHHYHIPAVLRAGGRRTPLHLSVLHLLTTSTSHLSLTRPQEFLPSLPPGVSLTSGTRNFHMDRHHLSLL